MHGATPRLRLKGTFIDVDDGGENSLSPRARSEPRTPCHVKMLFQEQQQRYVAQLGDNCGYGRSAGRGWSHSFKTPARGFCGAASAIDAPRRTNPWRTLKLVQLGPAPGHKQADTENQTKAQSSSSLAPRVPPRSDEPASKEASSSTAGAGEVGSVRRLSLADLVRSDNAPSAGREDSPCRSRQGNADSGSDWDGDGPVSEVSSKSSARKLSRSQTPQQLLVPLPVPEDPNDRGVQVFANYADSVCLADAVSSVSTKGWIGGPGSEPGSRWRNRRRDRTREPLEKCGTPSTPSRTPVHAGGPPTEAQSLSALCGKWQVTGGEDETWEGGMWTIDNGGRAFFNGKRFGNDYDIFENSAQGDTVLQRGDGWTANMESPVADQLVWKKPGEGKDITWTRTLRASGNTSSSKRNETTTELRSKMQTSAQRMSDGWGSEGRYSSAMAVIEEIPRRLTEDMQRAASYVVDSMQSEVAAMSKQIRDCDGASSQEARAGESRSNTEKVIKNLEVIPIMVQNLLESRVEKARSKVRHRVQGMIQNLSVIQEEKWEDHEQLVSQMRLISEEVEQIAGDAVKAAAQECHAHASRQLDFALTALRDQDTGSSPGGQEAADKGQPNAWGSIQAGGDQGGMGRVAWEVTHDPEFWPKTVSDAFVKNTMEQAVAVVQDKDYIPQSLTNQVVADELLRARIRSGGGGHRAETATASARSVPRNPGSRGHPNLCVRPCLYFAQGKCTNGIECLFCHMPHPKRPVRLDKAHRETVKSMPFDQFAEMMLPVLKQKASDLSFNTEITQLLEVLWPPLECHARAGAGPGERRRAAQGAAQGSGLRCTAGFSPESAGMLAALPASPSGGGGGSAVAADMEGGPRRVFRRDTSTSIHSAGGVSSTASGSDSKSSRRAQGFTGALQVMGFRSLLSMLTSKVPEGSQDMRDLVERVLAKIQICSPEEPESARDG